MSALAGWAIIALLVAAAIFGPPAHMVNDMGAGYRKAAYRTYLRDWVVFIGSTFAAAAAICGLVYIAVQLINNQ